jgi:DNA-binding GntR family transcriptional regulator
MTTNIKNEVIEFLIQERVNVIKEKPSITQTDKKNLEYFQSLFKKDDSKIDLLHIIEQQLKKPIHQSLKPKKN